MKLHRHSYDKVNAKFDDIIQDISVCVCVCVKTKLCKVAVVHECLCSNQHFLMEFYHLLSPSRFTCTSVQWTAHARTHLQENSQLTKQTQSVLKLLVVDKLLC